MTTPSGPITTTALVLLSSVARQVWLQGRDNLQKRYLIHISGYNHRLTMRLLTGFSTPRCWANAEISAIWLRYFIDDQTDVVLHCLLIIGGPNNGAIFSIDVVLIRF